VPRGGIQRPCQVSGISSREHTPWHLFLRACQGPHGAFVLALPAAARSRWRRGVVSIRDASVSGDFALPGVRRSASSSGLAGRGCWHNSVGDAFKGETVCASDDPRTGATRDRLRLRLAGEAAQEHATEIHERDPQPSGPARSRPSQARPPSASCSASARYSSRYNDYDIYVNSNQPDTRVTVTGAGTTASWYTDSSGMPISTFMRLVRRRG
jgi:hypothetical protein